jgi:2-C-methyl-D-erythritol 4-phosphate cytidylyltransferase/2-C-methyl-D-erythritol 2,4-cyclodiphosphate synthase
MAPAGLARPKQFLCLRNLPLYWHCALTLSRCTSVEGIVFVLPERHVREEETRMRLLDGLAPPEALPPAFEDTRPAPLGIPWKAVPGGESRRDSVYHGLQALPSRCAFVLVHDAARPFASARLARRLIDALEEGAAGVIPGLPLSDTVKAVRDGMVEATPDRDALRAAQTPQAFRLDILREAHEKARALHWTATDDANLLERCGYAVRVIPGEAANRKITTPEDLALLREPPALPCCGYGYDVHRYGGDRPMKLGGVPIPNAPGISAHSDGDVLLHALMDAVLGCACLGDIGRLFPDDDPGLENINSAVLLDEVLRLAADSGVEVVQVDCTLIAQTPRIAPHAPAVRRNLARLLGLEETRVNVKATTEEGLGFTGGGLGIKAVVAATALRTNAGKRLDPPSLWG